MKVYIPEVNIYSYKDKDFIQGSFRADVLSEKLSDDLIFNSTNEIFLFPAFCDVHVHLREPGFFYKESIKTGTLAAAHGGYADVFSMPNLGPVPDTEENIKKQLEIIERDAAISVHPFASITIGEKGEELVEFEKLAPFAAGFSDDGKGVQSEELMKEAMQRAKHLNKVISAHCEDNTLLNGGYINDGVYSKAHGHKGISGESEWKQIERDIKLCLETGCKYHVCHISTQKSVELIREAKKQGADITCETAPHYLLLDETFLQEDGRFKMNPPLRSVKDREALIEGLCDGTIDMIATDHAPHSKEEKSGGLKNSLMGIVGLETAFPLLYTNLVKTNIITLSKLIELMSINPRERFSLPKTQDICIYDLSKKYIINSKDFLSKGKSTPFEGYEVYGENQLTIHGGKAVWTKES